MTRIIKGLTQAVRGERVLAVSPVLAQQVDRARWRRRPQLYAGRALTPQALNAQQDEITGHLITFGQTLAPGIASGLEAVLERMSGGTRWQCEIKSGSGLTAVGEDVRLTQALRIDVDQIIVFGGAEDQTLGALRAANGDNPLALILLLQPLTIERVGQRNSRDVCELDPNDFAFDDARRIDGVRLVAVPYAGELPEGTSSFRNQLVYKIFDDEAALTSGAFMPWEATGLAVGLLGFAAASGDPFLDAQAVARMGGYANRRRTLLQSPGSRRLWQARFRQFMDELAELNIADLLHDGLASRFARLPPLGTLPAGVLDVRGDHGEPHLPLPSSPLFPPSFVIEAVPVELESLDDWLQGAASLAPIDLSAPEQLQVLVPLPQQYFDPDVLLVEDETPDEFRAALRLFLLRLNHRLGRRFDLRRDERQLQPLLMGSLPEHPLVDVDAVLGEVTDDFPEDDRLPKAERPPLEHEYAKDTADQLRAVVVRMAQVAGPIPLAVLHNRLLADLLGGEPTPVQAPTPEDVALFFVENQFAGVGISGFVDALSKKLLAAAEILDLMFSRTRSELYRVQAQVAGEAAATQLATSPVFSVVAPRPSGKTTQVQLESFKRFVLKLDKPERLPRVGELPPLNFPSEGTAGADGVPSALVFGTSILQRLASSLAADAKESAARAKRLAYRKLLEIHDSGLSLRELKFPGFRALPATARPDTATAPWDEGATPPDGQLVYRLISIEWIRFMIAEFDATGSWRHDPFIEEPNAPPPAPAVDPQDEAQLFATAIRSIEQTIAGLRIAEGRLAGFERALGLARERLQIDLENWAALHRRLSELNEQISDFRHDVRVARALEAEEITRAQRVNAERRQLLDEHVPFLVFRRPRSVVATLSVPTQVLAPARTPDPLPVALSGKFEAPEQLRLMVDLLRDAPLRWLRFAVPLLQAINRRAALYQVVRVAHFRASQPVPQIYEPFEGEAFQDETGEKIRDLYLGQKSTLEELTRERLRFDYTYYLRFSWLGLIPGLLDLATLNDLVLSNHGRQDVATDAVTQLERVYRVSAYLFDRLRHAPAFARLQWVERLSVANGSVDLRQLSALPDWLALEARDRRELQTLVDWLYQQVKLDDPAAVGFMHDLVRVCILLSTHAPLNQILQAQVNSARAIAPGGAAELDLDSTHVRIGMIVLLYETNTANTPAGRAVVEDLGDGVVTVRVLGTDGQRSIVPVRAEVIEPDRSPSVRLASGESAQFNFSSEATPR